MFSYLLLVHLMCSCAFHTAGMIDDLILYWCVCGVFIHLFSLGFIIVVQVIYHVEMLGTVDLIMRRCTSTLLQFLSIPVYRYSVSYHSKSGQE